MRLNEDIFEVDGKSFPNALKAEEYIDKKVAPIQEKIQKIQAELASLEKEKKEFEDKLREYYETGKKIQGEYDKDSEMSRKLRGPVGHDVDSDKRVKWMENVRRHLYG